MASLPPVEIANAFLTQVKAQGPLDLSHAARLAGAWTLAPLATAEGTIRARIVDAHILFDADVTVPIRQGQVDFNGATVEHVGPDSRMGVSRMGIHVDAPNGRSYLYQFAQTPVAGVEFENGTGPWAGDRGRLRLREFLEALLAQAPAAQGMGFTEQARLLLGRTSMSGELRLGDGEVAAPGLRAELTGGAQGHNTARIHSEAVGHGFAIEIASFSVRNVAATLQQGTLECGEATGALLLRLAFDGGRLRFEMQLADLKLAKLRVLSRA